jgi:hypothetical protein
MRLSFALCFKIPFFFCFVLIFNCIICRQDLSCFSSCRYQPPLPVDQVKPLNEYEDEGGELIAFPFDISN